MRPPRDRTYDYPLSQLTPNGIRRVSTAFTPEKQAQIIEERKRAEAEAAFNELSEVVVDVVMPAARAFVETMTDLHTTLAGILATNPPRHVRRRLTKKAALARHYRRVLHRHDQSAHHRGIQ